MSDIVEGLKAAGSIAGNIIAKGVWEIIKISYQGAKSAGGTTKEIIEGTAKGAVGGAKAIIEATTGK